GDQDVAQAVEGDAVTGVAARPAQLPRPGQVALAVQLPGEGVERAGADQVGGGGGGVEVRGAGEGAGDVGVAREVHGDAGPLVVAGAPGGPRPEEGPGGGIPGDEGVGTAGAGQVEDAGAGVE